MVLLPAGKDNRTAVRLVAPVSSHLHLFLKHRSDLGLVCQVLLPLHPLRCAIRMDRAERGDVEPHPPYCRLPCQKSRSSASGIPSCLLYPGEDWSDGDFGQSKLTDNPLHWTPNSDSVRRLPESVHGGIRSATGHPLWRTARRLTVLRN